MSDIYEEIHHIMSELEMGKDFMEMMLLNGKNEKANYYIQEAMPYMNKALGWLSDAEFEISTTANEPEIETTADETEIETAADEKSTQKGIDS